MEENNITDTNDGNIMQSIPANPDGNASKTASVRTGADGKPLPEESGGVGHEASSSSPEESSTNTSKRTPATKNSIFSSNAGGQTTSWVDALPEELRGSAELRKFKDANDALKSYTNLVALAGKKGLKAPAPDAGEEAWSAYFTARRGGIEAPENYTTKHNAESLVGLDEEAFNVMSAYMFKNGFSDIEHSKVISLFAAVRERESELWEAENARRCADCERDLRHEWGAEYDANISAVRNFIGKFPEVASKLQAYGLENDVNMCRMLLACAEKVAESRAPNVPATQMSYKDLEKRISEVRSSAAFNDEKSPGFALAQDQYMALMIEKSKMRAAGLLPKPSIN
ncbi:MAG: hypothetical protein E7037_02380 [Verrucomicrobia bacterium]|nr:hypothetical protein [Verrucomicrobiota bacterium]